jgi:hypothetical protein
MKNATSIQSTIGRRANRFAIASAAILCMSIASALAGFNEDAPGAAGDPYPNMPAIAPLGVRIGRHLDIPESAKGPAIDPAKGYRLQDLGQGLYMITDNGYQSIFMATTEEFADHAPVADGASNLFVEIFGPDAGHVRLVYGVQSLPVGAPVIVDVIFEIEPAHESTPKQRTVT